MTMISRSDNVVELLWKCSNCLYANNPKVTTCVRCWHPRLNGSWPRQTWMRERLKLVRKEKLDDV